MSFEKDLLGPSSQEAVLHLQDTEIDVLELMKACLMARVECDRVYAQSLKNIAARVVKLDNRNPKTPLIECWKVMMQKTSDVAAIIQRQADLIVNSSVEKLSLLINDKKSSRILFAEEKHRYEQELNKAKSCINKNYGEYNKAMIKVKQKKAEINELCQKGKNSAKVEDTKRKYNVLTDKLHRSHNDYVLSMREGKDVQDGLLNKLLPMYMSAQQDYCQDAVAQCKAILSEYVQYSDTTNIDSMKLHSIMRESIAAVSPKKEYVEFIAHNKSESRFDQLEFDDRLLQGYEGQLLADTLAVDETTFSILSNLKGAYQQKLSAAEAQLESYQEQSKTVREELQKLPHDTKMSESVPRKRHLKVLERHLEEARLTKQRQTKLHTLINDQLKGVDPENLPSVVNDRSDSRSSSLTNQQNGEPTPPLKSSASSVSIKSKFGKLKQRLMSSGDGRAEHSANSSPRGGKRPCERDEYCVVVPGEESKYIRMTSDPGLPLEDEEWFHGMLPRDEVQRLLKQDGDYLVRESKKRTTNENQYVLSVMWQGPKHFIIQTSDVGWRLEGQSFPTVQQLIINQHNAGTAVTNKSQAILKQPIMRETWQVKNDDVHLDAKIGNGNFGEVFSGTYKGKVVAVKTCKENLSEEQKKKFIGEARILRQYDHPNIVKFVGIAAQKNPVMIVMEYVSGGALLGWLRKFALGEPKKNLIQMCVDAAEGMEYLETKNVIHRDLAARNCLVSDTKVVKISDFGMSREEEEYVVSSGMRQIPIKWTAPEALNYGKYTSLCDVWSFGVLMWEVFSCGKTPYPGMKNQEARDRVDAGYRMSAPEDCPNAVYTIMRDCWEEQVEKRPHFVAIVRELRAALHEMR